MSLKIHLRSHYARKEFPACGVWKKNSRLSRLTDRLVEVTCDLCLRKVSRDDIEAGLQEPPVVPEEAKR